VDAHSHLAVINDHIRRVLSTMAPPTERPKSPALTEETWALVRARRPARAALLGHNARVRANLLATAWASWTHRRHTVQCLHAQFAELCTLQALATRQLDLTADPLKQALRDDKLAHRRNTCKAIRAAGLANDTSTVHTLVRQLAGRRKHKAPLAVALADGSLAKSPSEAAERWRQHAQELHGGRPVEFRELLADADSTQFKFASIPRSILAVPTLTEVVGTFAACMPKRAHGSDCIPPAIIKSFADVLAPIFHPLMVKSALRISEPLQWRGGVLAHFPKAKGNPSKCADNREIVLADVTGKAFHKCRRSRLKPLLEASARETQMGGIARRSTDFGSHYVRTAIELGRISGQSTACLFIDVVSAFYNLVRAHVVPIPQGDGCFLSDCILTQNNVGPHLAASAAAATLHTWFAIQASPMLTEYDKGVLPGDPEADLAFTLLATKVLNEIHEALRAKGLTPNFPQAAEEPALSAGCEPITDWPPDVSYVDDATFIFQGPADRITAMVEDALQTVHSVFAKFSLQLNFGPGKTEVLLDVSGRGSKAVRQELCFDRNYKLEVTLAGQPTTIHICRSYKHLGGQISVGGSLATEVKHRSRETSQVLAEMRRPFLYCKESDQADRNAVISPYLWSRLFYNAGTWTELPPGLRKQFNGTYMRVVNAAAAVTYRDGVPSLTAPDALRATKQPRAEEALRAKRLCYLPRLLRFAPAPLLVLLDLAPSWRNALIADLEWLSAGSTKVAELPPPGLQLQAWLDFARGHPKAWCSIVQQMLTPPPLQEQPPADNPSDRAPPPAHEPNELSGERLHPCSWLCYNCGAAFHSRRALASHATRAHAKRSDASSCMFGTACIACLREFHTRTRLSGHLLHGSIACAEAIARSTVPPSDEEVGALLTDERARIAHARSFPGRHLPCHMPMCRLPGPLPSWAPVHR